MRAARFDEILQARIADMIESLQSKSKEYASDKDRLHNFKHAAQITRKTPAQALLGMWVKHVVSIIDIVESEARDGFRPSVVVLNEKFRDAMNYLILLEAMLKEGAADG